jgi:hypothetical protein
MAALLGDFAEAQDYFERARSRPGYGRAFVPVEVSAGVPGRQPEDVPLQVGWPRILQ